MQNVVTARSVSVDLAPGETKTVNVDAHCLNRDKYYPSDAYGKLTKLGFALPFSGQDDVWNGVANPDIEEDQLTDLIRGLRREMNNLINDHDTLEIIADDIGIKYDNLRGEVLYEKIHFLVGECKKLGRLPRLLKRLLEDYSSSDVFSDVADAIRGIAA